MRWHVISLLVALLVFPEAGHAASRAQRAPHVERAADVTDSELDAAWVRAGCTRNPSNPVCAIISQAAGCADAPGVPACRADRDGDGCLDIAEVRVGLDPFDTDDCLGDRHGAPLVNCLFLIGNARCHKEPIPGPADPPPIDCPPLSRNPECDGFAPETGQNTNPGAFEAAS